MTTAARATACQRAWSLAPEVARDPVVPVLGQQRWHLARRRSRGAELLAQRAARMEPAAGRWIDRAGHVAAQDDPRAPHRRVRDRDRRHQGLRVGMVLLLEERPSVGQLGDPAQVHHRDPVADVLHDAHVVGDEQVGQPELALQLLAAG